MEVSVPSKRSESIDTTCVGVFEGASLFFLFFFEGELVCGGVGLLPCNEFEVLIEGFGWISAVKCESSSWMASRMVDRNSGVS